jgi:hypothetical protein
MAMGEANAGELLLARWRGTEVWTAVKIAN